MTANLAVGIDLGGTELKVALVASDGQILAVDRTATDVTAEPDAIIETMAMMARPFLARVDTRAIGVCSPGPLDRSSGVVVGPPTLPKWRDVPLKSWLGQKLGMAVVLENDAHAAALGEWRLGAGRGIDSFVYITVSTGIGGAAVVDGHLLRGRLGLAGHVGHMNVACNGSDDGTWETRAAGPALAFYARAAILQEPDSILAAMADSQTITARHVGEAARRGDALALRLLADEAHWLGLGIVNLLHLYSPERIIVGGGVSALFDLLHEGIAATIKSRALPSFHAVPIVRAAFGADAGVIGAARLAFEPHF